MNYILKTGAGGAARLTSVHALYGKESQILLKMAGIKPGMKVVDAGCGTGNMMIWLARQVGPKGQVIALDSSQKQITLAKKLAKDSNLNNITFLKAPAENLSNFVKDADLIYSRLLLVHSKNPKNTLEVFREAISNSGIIVCEEPITSASFCLPTNLAFRKHLALYRKLGQKHGFDFDFGKQLPKFMQTVKITLLGVRKTQCAFSSQQAKLIAFHRTNECGKKYLQENLINKKELIQLLTDLKQLSKKEKNLISGVQMIQTWGSKS